jgi:hypothetical protein
LAGAKSFIAADVPSDNPDSVPAGVGCALIAETSAHRSRKSRRPSICHFHFQHLSLNDVIADVSGSVIKDTSTRLVCKRKFVDRIMNDEL